MSEIKKLKWNKQVDILLFYTFELIILKIKTKKNKHIEKQKQVNTMFCFRHIYERVKQQKDPRRLQQSKSRRSKGSTLQLRFEWSVG